MCFLTGFFFFSPRRKPSLLLLSVSLILHLHLTFEGFGVALTFQGNKSPWRAGLVFFFFKAQYLEKEFLLPNADSPREK